MSLAERLGIGQEVLERTGALQGNYLPDSDALIDQARAAAATDPEQAQALLAAALLSAGEKTVDGRHVAALSLLSRILASADPARSLGEAGAAARAECMPNGWKYTIVSFERLRYAWRCGMDDLLGPFPPELIPVAHALDEVTRLNPAEPEPTKVTIQEHAVGGHFQAAVSVLGLGFLAFGAWSSRKQARAAPRRAAAKKAKRRR